MPGERILIAEDEPDVRDVARLTLELAGYQITTAQHGMDAVEKARQGNFDLFLTDVKMPYMDGLDAFQEVRREDPEIVGVVMTGYGTMSIAIQAIKNGFADFVIKPFTPDELTSAVARSLEKERLRRENVRLKALIPLFELSRHFMSETRLPVLLDQVVQTGLTETRASHAHLLLYQETGQLLCAAQAGEPLADDAPWRLVAEQVVESRQPLVVNLPLEPVLQRASPAPALVGQQSLIALPLYSKERVLGALLMDKAPDMEPFTEVEAELLSVLAGQAAIAIDNARLFEERDAAFAELSQMDHMKSEFINIAAHELRTPLSLVLGYAGLLEESGDAETEDYAHAITQNALRLRAIVEDMTNLRYLETNQTRLHVEWVDLAQVIHQAVDTARLGLSDKRVDLQLELAPRLERVQADRKKLELVLSSLLSNAYKFSPSGGMILVRTEETASDVTVSVQDEGPGIPLSEQPKIWKRFYQVEESMTRVHGGIGLGLAIVKGMVELHHGRVWVESTEKRGSTFYFTLPKRGVIR